MNNSPLNSIGINSSIKKVEDALRSVGGWAPRKLRKNPIKKEELIEQVGSLPKEVAIAEVVQFIEEDTSIKMEDLRSDFATVRIELYQLFEHQAKMRRMKEEEEELFLLLVLLNHRRKIGNVEFKS